MLRLRRADPLATGLLLLLLAAFGPALGAWLLRSLRLLLGSGSLPLQVRPAALLLLKLLALLLCGSLLAVALTGWLRRFWPAAGTSPGIALPMALWLLALPLLALPWRELLGPATDGLAGQVGSLSRLLGGLAAATALLRSFSGGRRLG